jgi:hypothetical protein
MGNSRLGSLPQLLWIFCHYYFTHQKPVLSEKISYLPPGVPIPMKTRVALQKLLFRVPM